MGIRGRRHALAFMVKKNFQHAEWGESVGRDLFQGRGVEFDSCVVTFFDEGLDFVGCEEEAAELLAELAAFVFDFAGQDSVLVAMAEDVGEDGFQVFGLIGAGGEGAGSHGIRAWKPLEEEAHGTFLGTPVCEASSEGRGFTTDRRHRSTRSSGRVRVAFMGTEGKEAGDFFWVLGGLAVFIEGALGGQGFIFACEGLDFAHSDGAGGPIDDNGKADGVGCGDAPGVGVGTEGGKDAAEGDDFSEACGAGGVGEIAFRGRRA